MFKIKNMKHFVEIDDSTETGKSIIDLLKALSKSEVGIEVIDDHDLVDTIPFKSFTNNLLSTLENKLKNQ